ncbi:hypothetical protein GGR57DRAFT_505936 [Xylariaceae sp. FL1272]|nr:hypothetical protein GGR57DRAFT_505936 [Xylariaceae sp. FL1272]
MNAANLFLLLRNLTVDAVHLCTQIQGAPNKIFVWLPGHIGHKGTMNSTNLPAREGHITLTTFDARNPTSAHSSSGAAESFKGTPETRLTAFSPEDGDTESERRLILSNDESDVQELVTYARRTMPQWLFRGYGWSALNLRSRCTPSTVRFFNNNGFVNRSKLCLRTEFRGSKRLDAQWSDHPRRRQICESDDRDFVRFVNIRDAVGVSQTPLRAIDSNQQVLSNCTVFRYMTNRPHGFVNTLSRTDFRGSKPRTLATVNESFKDATFPGLITFEQKVPQPTLPRLRVLSLTVASAPAAFAQVLRLHKLTSLARNGIDDAWTGWRTDHDMVYKTSFPSPYLDSYFFSPRTTIIVITGPYQQLEL